MHAPTDTDRGLAFFTSFAEGRGAARRSAPAAPRRNPDIIGWVPPVDIYAEMRNIDASAASLDGLVRANITDPTFGTGWAAWLTAWRNFFAPYREEGALNNEKAAAVFHSDGLKLQTDSYWSQLAGWQRSYNEQVGPGGRRVPGVPAPLPMIAPTPAQLEQQREKSSGWTLPWWAWTGLGVAAVGAGFWVYYTAKEMLAKRRAIETKVLPAVFSTYAGPHVGGALAEAAAARDVARSRDLFSLNRYVAEGPIGGIASGRGIAPPVTFEHAKNHPYTMPPEEKSHGGCGGGRGRRDSIRGRGYESEDLYSNDYDDE